MGYREFGSSCIFKVWECLHRYTLRPQTEIHKMLHLVLYVCVEGWILKATLINKLETFEMRLWTTKMKEVFRHINREWGSINGYAQQEEKYCLSNCLCVLYNRFQGYYCSVHPFQGGFYSCFLTNLLLGVRPPSHLRITIQLHGQGVT